METRKVVLSRDVKWVEWVKLKPTHRMSIFEKQPELLEDECCIEKAEEYEIVDMDEEHYEGQVVQPVQNPVLPVQNPVLPVQNPVQPVQNPVQNAVKAAQVGTLDGQALTKLPGTKFTCVPTRESRQSHHDHGDFDRHTCLEHKSFDLSDLSYNMLSIQRTERIVFDPVPSRHAYVPNACGSTRHSYECPYDRSCTRRRR